MAEPGFKPGSREQNPPGERHTVTLWKLLLLPRPLGWPVVGSGSTPAPWLPSTLPAWARPLQGQEDCSLGLRVTAFCSPKPQPRGAWLRSYSYWQWGIWMQPHHPLFLLHPLGFSYATGLILILWDSPAPSPNSCSLNLPDGPCWDFAICGDLGAGAPPNESCSHSLR